MKRENIPLVIFLEIRIRLFALLVLEYFAGVFLELKKA